MITLDHKNRLEAEIATVKELIAEAQSIGDILGTHSLKSRLKAIELEYNTLEGIVDNRSLDEKLDACWYKIGYLNICDRDEYNALLSEVSDSHYSAYGDEHDEEQKET